MANAYKCYKIYFHLSRRRARSVWWYANEQATGMLWAVVIPEMAAGQKPSWKFPRKSLQRRRSTPSGDGFIDSVFTAIMQMSSTIIPKYIESGFGRDYLSFQILAFYRKNREDNQDITMSLFVSLSIPGVSLRMLSLPQLQGSRRQLVPFALKRVWHPMKLSRCCRGSVQALYKRYLAI